MKFVDKFVQKAPRLIIAVIILITLFFGYHAAQIEINTDIKDMFPEGHPALETFDHVSDKYGGSEYVIVLFEDQNIIDTQTLSNIDSLTQSLDQLDEVNKVRSITNIEEITGSGMTVEVKEYLKEIPKTKAEANELQADLKTKDRYLGSLVSEDFQVAPVIAQLNSDVDQAEVVKKVNQIVEEANFEEETYLAGSPVLSKRMTDKMKSDILRLFPLVSIIVLLILFASFRSMRGVLLPIMIVLFSVVWTIGLISLTGNTLSMVSTALPVLLVSVGSAYAIHFLARYYEDLSEGATEVKAISLSILKVGTAIAMAGITTMIGFSSLALSDLSIIQEFGMFTAFGVFSALLISITFLPAVLLLMEEPSHYQAAEERPLLDNFFAKLNSIVQHRYTWVIGIVIIFTILSLVIIPKLEPETNYIAFFEKGSRTRQADNLINDKIGGGTTFEIIVNTGQKNGMENPQFLQKVKELQEGLEKHKLLNNAMSVVDLLEEENKALHGGQEKFEKLPQQGIAQYLMLLSSGSNILEDFTDFNHQEVRIRVMVAEADNSQRVAKLVDYTENLIKDKFPEYEIVSREKMPEEVDQSAKTITFTGVPVLTDVLTGLVISSQVKSLISAVLFAFLVTSFLLKSPLKGLACSLPVAFTVILNFGIMGWTAITLNVATIMIASVAVGIGVDYSIHFYTRYLEELEADAGMKEALKTAIFTIGRANFFNATAVIAGFLVLLLSSIPPLRKFGLLTSITMVVSFFGAMVFLPSMILFRDRVLLPLLGKEEESITK